MAANGIEYLIQIAAAMTGGDSSVAQLTELADQLRGAGTASVTFESAIAQTRSALEQASSASTAANEALAAGERHYKQLEQAAVRASKALEKAELGGSKRNDMHVLAHSAAMAAEALKTEAAALDQLKAKASSAATEQMRLANAMKHLEAGAKSAAKAEQTAAAAARGTGNLGKLSGALGQLGGPLGSVGQKVTGVADAFSDLLETMGTGAGGVVGVAVALAAAVALVTVAIGAAIVKTAMWAVGLADTARSMALTVAGLEASSESLSGLSQVLPGLQRSTGLATAELAKMAEQLETAGVKADAMPDALRAIATATAGGASSKMLADLNAELKSGKKSAAELAKEMEQRFGKVVAKRLLSLDSQTETLKRNLASTFGGLKIEGLLEQLSRLVGLLDSTGGTGKTIKIVFEKLFQPVIDGAAKAGLALEAFLLGVEIGALKVAIAFKPAAKEIAKLFDADTSKLPAALDVAIFLGEQLGRAIGIVAVGIGLIAAAIAPAVQGFLALYGAGVKAWEGLKAGAAKVMAYLSGISLASIGANLVQGLANGITGAAGRVVAAITGVVSGAISTARKLLGEASPSKVFAGIGENTALGFAQGVEGGSGGAQSALESLVEPPSVAAGGTSTASAGNTYQIIIQAPDGSQQGLATEVRRIMHEVFAGDLIELGGMEPVPT